MDYFLLNGKSFPYTIKESIVFIDDKGWPVTFGVGWDKYFDEKYYQAKAIDNGLPDFISGLMVGIKIYNLVFALLLISIISVFVIRVYLYLRSKR